MPPRPPAGRLDALPSEVAWDLPAVPGVLTSAQVAQTARAIAAVQEPDGAVPFSVGAHVDAWNHVEAAMAMLVGGQVEAAEAAYSWCLRTQREDGSWPIHTTGGRVEDPNGDTNMSAYLAVGVWHHWLLRRDAAFVRRCWPAVRRGLDFVTAMQLPFGGIAWSRTVDGRVSAEALLAGSSSIYHALRAGLALAGLVGAEQPDWELTAARLRHALEDHRDLFLDKAAFSMDWYYPVLAGPVRGADARAVLEARWHDFVVRDLGCRCLVTNPWVTGAETAELALALVNLGDHDRARALLADVQHTRHPDGLYWTGYVYPDDALWPEEQTTYTAAAIVLAADAVSGTSPAAALFRGVALPPDPQPLALHCGCAGPASVPVSR